MSRRADGLTRFEERRARAAALAASGRPPVPMRKAIVRKPAAPVPEKPRSFRCEDCADVFPVVHRNNQTPKRCETCARSRKAVLSTPEKVLSPEQVARCEAKRAEILARAVARIERRA